MSQYLGCFLCFIKRLNVYFEIIYFTLFVLVPQMAVMEEVHNQMTEITTKQNDKISELSAEIRKLKAMIVKHESRIRTLETKNRELEQACITNNNGQGGGGSGHSAGEDLDPDEV